ncbi:maleylacetoacetate isomerase [Rheinheimera sediminis]|uniref:maleylacetoacetate isomerase n=1 Tax=Rheinheimera sp. YQF-1 TaxID=2499626 RepID=UPI000FD9F23B|nr:maleylacetoacetate isomerase [Rheinheimera sp. YQF-1]RVT45835.1 maleylacetoacetate isomerase [Rheinheimera sp. YQF-1]
MKLHGYWRSSAAYRVRIALNIKGLEAEHCPVHLINNGGEQHSSGYQLLNPAKLVPTLEDGELSLNQSLAIIQYLEDCYPASPLLPKDPVEKAAVIAFALDIACDIHPLNNLRVLHYLTGPLALSETQKLQWIQHWLAVGFSALEKRLQTTSGLYCFGDAVTLADLCLVPQVYNALRFQLDMTDYPLIHAIYQRCNTIEAFQHAAPERQVDAV